MHKWVYCSLSSLSWKIRPHKNQRVFAFMFCFVLFRFNPSGECRNLQDLNLSECTNINVSDILEIKLHSYWNIITSKLIKTFLSYPGWCCSNNSWELSVPTLSEFVIHPCHQCNSKSTCKVMSCSIKLTYSKYYCLYCNVAILSLTFCLLLSSYFHDMAV